MAIVKADFEQMMNQARIQLVGASEAGLKGTFYDVLFEFLNDSSIWTETVAIPVVPTERVYSASVPEGTIVRLNGVGASQDRFIPALMSHIGIIELRNPPQNNDTYYAQFVVNIAQPTGRDMIPLAPSWLLPIWHLGLLDGLLGNMMNQPNKSYSNPTSAAYHLKRFRDAIARARVSKLRANTVGASAWRFPQSFRSVSQQGGVPAIGSANERSF